MESGFQVWFSMLTFINYGLVIIFFNRIETWLSSKRVEDFHDRGFVLVDVQEFPLEGRENAHFTPEIDSEYGIYLRLR